jgi:hypothetical protein
MKKEQLFYGDIIMKLSIENKIISVSSSRWAFIIFIVCGLISMATGIIMHGRIMITDQVLIGMGIVFVSGGMLFLINARSYDIEIVSDKGVLRILDSRRGTSLPLEIPIEYFKHIIITKSMIEQASGRRHTAGYELSLMSDSGSSLQVASFNDREKAVRFGKELQDILNIDLVSEEDSIRIFLGHRTGCVYSLDVNLPEKSGIVSVTDDDSIVVKWNCRKSLIQNLFIATIIYGFFHLVHFAVVPNAGNPIASTAGYGILALMILIVWSIIVMNALGTYYLVISKTAILYYVSLFGIKMGARSMEKAEIGMIRHSIGGQDNTIQLMSTKGLEIVRELMNAFNRSSAAVPDISMAGAIFSLKDEMMSINVSSLSVREKWYIASRMLRG